MTPSFGPFGPELTFGRGPVQDLGVGRLILTMSRIGWGEVARP